MSAITKTTIELTPAQKIAIARHTAQRQLETGETWRVSSVTRWQWRGESMRPLC